MRYFLFFGLAVCLMFPSGAAQAGWLDFLFPKQDNTPDPAKTLRAPFANQDAVIEDFNARGESMTPLHLRHRPSQVIVRWAQEVIPVLLTYEAGDYDQAYREKIQQMSQVGAQEYTEFLREENYLTTLKTGRYNVNGFISDYPLVVSEGTLEGRYRWAVQTNIMVTFMDSNARNKDAEQITKEYNLTFQVGRSDKAVSNEHGVVIETWNIAPKKD